MKDGEGFPLSTAQLSIWLAQVAQPTVPYTVAQYVEITGDLDVDAVLASLGSIGHQTESAATRILQRNNELRQVIDHEGPWRAGYVDLRREADPEAVALDRMRTKASRIVDMRTEQLLVQELLHVADDRYFLFGLAHHVVVDGVGAIAMLDAVAETYSALRSGVTPPVRSRMSIRELVDYQQEYRQTTRYAADRAYWLDRVRTLPAPARLSDRSYPPAQRTAVVGAAIRNVVAPENRAIDGYTDVTIVLAAISVYIARMTGQRRVVLSLPVSGRVTAKLRNSAGMLANVVPLCVEVPDGGTIGDLLRGIVVELTGALRHQRYRFEDMLRDLGEVSDPSGRQLGAGGRGAFGPTVNIMMFDPLRFGDAVGEYHVLSSGPVDDIMINVYPSTRGDDTRVDFLANPRAYDDAELAAHHRAFMDLLVAVGASKPDTLLGTLLPAAEPIAEAPEPTVLLPALLSAREGTAVIDSAGALDYRDLEATSNALARILITAGAGPGERVAVALPRGREYVIALWAVAKSGAAIVPIDPTDPTERTAGRLAALGVRLGVTGTSADPVPTVRWLPMPGRVDRALPASTPLLDADRPAALLPGHEAYVLHTSGSTGTPKAVSVTHTGLASLVAAVGDRWATEETPRVAHLAAPTFDVSMLEILVTAHLGGTLVIPDPDVIAGDPVGEWVRRHAVTHLSTVPAVLGSLDPADLGAVRVIQVGGDRLDPAVAERFAAPTRRLFNAYGLTETTVEVLSTTVADADAVPPRTDIGAALPGVRASVLDGKLQTVPRGGVGELYIEGPSLARGYVGRPALTATRFVAAPGGTRRYRTGDLVRIHVTDGRLDILGRGDEQVQIHGRRFEPGEVTAALLAHPAIRDAVTVVRGQQLVGYVAADAPLDPVTVITHLRALLPTWMVPARVVRIDRLPLTTAGKVDRDALPEPGVRRDVGAPEGPVETAVAAAMSEVLPPLPAGTMIGREHSFFELGGDSLSATRLIERLDNRLGGATPSLADIFADSTVAGIAAAVVAARERPVVEATPEVTDALGPAELRLWVLNQLDPTSTVFTMPLAVRSKPGAPSIAAVIAAVGVVVDRHEALRSYFPVDNGEPVRRVVPTERMPAPEIREVDADRFDAIIADAGHIAFDLTDGPPLRIGAYTSGDRWLLTVAVHHINLDGWSADILTADLLAEIFGAPDTRSPAPPGPALAVARRLAQVEAVGAELLDERRRAFARLIGSDPVAELPADRPAEAGASGGAAAANEPFTVDAAQYARMRDLAATVGSTPFAVLHAAVALVLSAMSGSPATVVASVVSGRDRPEVAGTVGLLVETIALPVRVDVTRSVFDHLAAVRDADRGSIAAADLPFQRLIEAIPTAAARMLVTFDTSDRQLPDLPIERVDIDTATTEFDLALDLRESGGALTGRLRYATARYDRATARAFGRAITVALEQMIADPARTVGAIALPGRSTAPEDGAADSSSALFGSRIPVVDTDGTVLGRDDLASRVDRLAALLVERGAGPDVPVAIHLGRGADYVVAVLAIWAAGAAFVPIDPAAPTDRRLAMTAFTRLGVAGDTDPGIPGVSWIDSAVAYAGAGSVGTGSTPALPFVAPVVHPDALAYVIHTSGTTGIPKPVALTRRAVAALADDVVDRYRVTVDSVVAQGYSTAFDAAVLELVLALTTGARLAIVPDGLFGGFEMAQWLAETGVTHFLSTPAALATVPTVDTVRVAAVGGDVCPPGLVGKWGVDRPLLNAYGPTEAAVVSTLTGPLRPGTEVTIGVPLPTVSWDVLSTDLRTVPTAGVGELYVGGPHLARGYLGSPAETAARFVAAPGGVRRYRTGDLVRLRPDGELDFRGRIDSQIQLFGRRVELDEPAAVLRRYPGVEDVAVAHDGVRLHAWLVGSVPDSAWMTTHLPPWMIPSRLHRIAVLPLTANGKVDRRALLDGIEPPTAAVARSPQSLHEDLVCGIYAEVLGVDRVDPEADFFESGGDSLRAARIAGRLTVATGTRIPIREVLDTRSPRELARRIPLLAGVSVAERPPVRTGSGTQPSTPSPGEMRMWTAQRLEPSSAARNLAVAVDVPAELSAEVIVAAVVDVIDRHETLRTRYPNDGGRVRAVVEPSRNVIADVIAEVETTDLAAAERAVAGEPIDPSIGPPMRIRLLRSDTGARSLVIVVHHIAVDGASLEVLGRDFRVALAARAAGRASEFAPVPVRYADYRNWIAELVGTPDRPTAQAQENLAYWRAVLHDRPEQPALPVGDIDPDVTDPVVFDLPAAMGTAVTAVAREANATVFTVLHAVLAVTLAGLAGTDDVIVGTPVSGRTEPEFDDVVGMFAGTVPLRTRLPRTAGFGDFLGQVRDVDLDAFAHQDIPIEWVTSAVDGSTGMPFNMIFVVHPPSPELTNHNGIRSISVAAAQFDIDWVLTELSAGGFTGEVRFDAGRYGRDAIVRMVETFERVLRAVIDDPTRALAAMPTGAIVAPPVALPAAPTAVAPITLGEIFRSAVVSSPDAEALVDSGHRWTYRSLDARAESTAAQLRAGGVGPGDVVAIVLPRSAEFVVAVWAVARTGAAFLPIDPGGLAVGISAMLDAMAPVAVIDSDGVRISGADRRPALRADQRPVRPDDPAYLIDTSGSDGAPKAIRVSHRGLAYVVRGQRERFGVGPDSRVLLGASPSVDAAIFEILLAVTGGAALVVPPIDVVAGDEMTRTLGAFGVTHVCLTPSVLAAIDPGRAPTVTTVISAGEAVNSELLRSWATAGRDRRVFNAYGPTEATLLATCSAPIGRTDLPSPTAAPSIGPPIGGVRIAVLDGWLRPVGIGTAGELYLSGPTLAEGYQGDPALTATRFVADPLGPPGARRYRTGDLVRLRPVAMSHVNGAADTGTVPVEPEFLGRVDDQLTIRGHRVEPAEIEAALVADGDIAAAAVIGVPRSDGTTALAAYVTTRPGNADPAPADLRARLSRRLPRYLVPSTIQVVDRVPLTVSGRLDLRALPAPEQPIAGYRPPVSATENAVAEVFAEVLETPQYLESAQPIGLDDDFFDRGGHSLAAVRVADLLRDRLAVPVPVAAVFTHPTPATLARYIDQVDPALESSSDLNASLDVLLPIRPGTGPALFCIHPAVGLAWSYLALAEGIDRRVPLYGLQAPQISGASAPEDIEHYARIYADRIRAAQPAGPYRILGWSLGGVIAHAVARQLTDQGAEVDLLVLLDTWLDVAPDAPRFRPADLARHLGIDGGRDHDQSVDRDAPNPAESGFDRIVARLRHDHPALAGLTADHLERAFQPMDEAATLVAGYRATRIDVPTVLVLAQDSTADRSWGDVLPPDSPRHRVAAAHNDLLGPRARSQVVETINRYLRGLIDPSPIAPPSAARPPRGPAHTAVALACRDRSATRG